MHVCFLKIQLKSHLLKYNFQYASFRSFSISIESSLYISLCLIVPGFMDIFQLVTWKGDKSVEVVLLLCMLQSALYKVDCLNQLSLIN